MCCRRGGRSRIRQRRQLQIDSFDGWGKSRRKRCARCAPFSTKPGRETLAEGVQRNDEDGRKKWKEVPLQLFPSLDKTGRCADIVGISREGAHPPTFNLDTFPTFLKAREQETSSKYALAGRDDIDLCVEAQCCC